MLYWLSCSLFFLQPSLANYLYPGLESLYHTGTQACQSDQFTKSNSTQITTHYYLNKYSNFLTNSILPNTYLREPLTAPLRLGPTAALPHHHATYNGASKGSLIAFKGTH
jgi:hypothetical protein